MPTVQTAAELERDFAPSECEYSGTCASFHNLVIQRIYHEDNLFATRANVLLAVHAFLMTAFAILMAELMTQPMEPQNKAFTWALAGAIGLFGALLGIFQAALGRQTNRTITFWREYARLIEAAWKIPFDHLQYDFYAHARVQTPFGTLDKKDVAQKSLYQLFGKTRFTTSTVSMIGLILPASLAAFWASVFGYAIDQLTSGLPLLCDTVSWGIFAGLLPLSWGIFVLRPSLAQPGSEKSQTEPRT